MKRQGKNTFSTYGDVDMPKYANSNESIQSSAEVKQARHQAIEEAAYCRASERGFVSGGELDDWLGAEADFDGAQIGNNNV